MRRAAHDQAGRPGVCCDRAEGHAGGKQSSSAHRETTRPGQLPRTKLQEQNSQNTPCLNETFAPITTTPPQHCSPPKTPNTSCNTVIFGPLTAASLEGKSGGPSRRSRSAAAPSTHYHPHASVGHIPSATHTCMSTHMHLPQCSTSPPLHACTRTPAPM